MFGMSGASLLLKKKIKCLLFAVRSMVAMPRVREQHPSIGTFTVSTIRLLLLLYMRLY